MSLNDNSNSPEQEAKERAFRLMLNCTNSSFLKELRDIWTDHIAAYEDLKQTATHTAIEAEVIDMFLKESEDAYLSAKRNLPIVNLVLADRNVNPEHN